MNDPLRQAFMDAACDDLLNGGAKKAVGPAQPTNIVQESVSAPAPKIIMPGDDQRDAALNAFAQEMHAAAAPAPVRETNDAPAAAQPAKDIISEASNEADDVLAKMLRGIR